MEKVTRGVISKDLIFLDSPLTSQDAVIKKIVQTAAAEKYVTDSQALFAAVKKREAEIPTAIGYDIAIPHGKTAAVADPFIAFVRTEKAFQWSNQSEEEVRLIFLIGVPEDSQSKLHLKFISQLSKKLLDETFRNKLLTESDVEKIYQQLNEIEI